MMHEVLVRHFGRLLEEKRPLPDLVMVDGGKGQLSAAIDALVEINCPPLPVIGLAKRNEEIYLPGRSEPVVLDRHDPALRMLQALRDEAHRFAITYHRELRNKLIEQSKLDEIPGIGVNRQTRTPADIRFAPGPEESRAGNHRGEGSGNRRRTGRKNRRGTEQTIPAGQRKSPT